MNSYRTESAPLDSFFPIRRDHLLFVSDSTPGKKQKVMKSFLLEKMMEKERKKTFENKIVLAIYIYYIRNESIIIIIYFLIDFHLTAILK